MRAAPQLVELDLRFHEVVRHERLSPTFRELGSPSVLLRTSGEHAAVVASPIVHARATRRRVRMA